MKLLLGMSGLGAAAIAMVVMGVAGCSAAPADAAAEGGAPPLVDAGAADSADAEPVPEAGADADADAEVESPFKPPPDNGYYVRFVLATSDFAPGQPFDICFAPWNGNPANPPPDSAYIGPIGNAFGTALTAPEVLNYFKVASAALPAGGPIALRLVNPSQTSCAASQRFTIGGTATPLKVDDSTTPVMRGYNTAVIYGNVNNVTNLKLSAHVDLDPSTAPTAPTLQFFNGFGSDGTSLQISLTDVNDKVYAPSNGGAVSFGQYSTIAFTNGATAVNMKKMTLTPGTGAPIDIMLGFALTPGYYPGFAYGTAAGGVHGYLCDDATAIITGMSSVIASGCHL